MVNALRFIAGIILYFFATDLLENFFDITAGSYAWWTIHIFSDVISVVAVFLVSPYALAAIAMYLVYDIGSTIWNEEGFFNILNLCGNSMFQFWLAGLLIKLYENSTGKEYGEKESKDS